MKRIIFPFLLILVSAMLLTAESITVFTEESEMDLDLNYAHVVKVRAGENAGAWRFDVTLRHGDEGWDHYADLWLVVDTETGKEYGRRVLAHPHVNEQPFTRSQSGIKIPGGVTSVTVKAACTIHGFGGTELEIFLRK